MSAQQKSEALAKRGYIIPVTALKYYSDTLIAALLTKPLLQG